MNTGRNMTPGNLVSISQQPVCRLAMNFSPDRQIFPSEPVNIAQAFCLSRFSLSASYEIEDDSMPNQKPCARLENWAVVESANSASYQVLRAGSLLAGKVFSHPRIGEGTFIFTSPIVRLDEKRNVVETKNTSYQLGQASREYQMWTEEQTGAAA
jgi:hypothetical protein